MANATFDAIKIGIASPDMIRQWSYGERQETRDHQLPNPEAGAGRPVLRADLWTLPRTGSATAASTRRIRYKGKVCDQLRRGGHPQAKVRRDRMGHIELAAPACSHIWYFKGIPTRMGLILDISSA